MHTEKSFKAASTNLSNLFLIVFALALAILTGIVAAMGKVTYVAPIVSIMSIPVLARAGVQWRFYILLMLPFLNLFQMPSLHLPLGIPPVVVVMGILAIIKGLSLWQHKLSSITMVSVLEYLHICYLYG